MSTNRTSSMEENYAAIMAAWMNPGPHPAYHRAMKAEVRRTMPVLATALDRAYLEIIGRRPAHRPEIRPTTGNESGSERQRPRITVTDDMVERAARTFYEYPMMRLDASLRTNWDRLTTISPDVADNHRAHAAAALATALTPDESS